MAEPTTDRVTLRREIAKDLGMPFFKRFGSGIQAVASSDLDSTFFQDARLTQRRDFWKNMWLYDVSNDDFRRIADFRQEQRRLVPEFDFTATPTTASVFEIHSIYTPEEIHDAINDAIREAFPVFFDVVTDETIVLEQDKLTYDLTTNNSDGRGILSNPLRIKKIFVEQTSSGGTHQATAGAAGTITDDNATFTGVDTGWRVSIFAGVGSGQTQLVSSGDSNGVLTPIANWTVTPDTSSKFRTWNVSKEQIDWREISSVRFDAKDYPTNMYWQQRSPAWFGMRLRIQYIGEPQSLTADTAPTTVVPAKYIKHYAMGKLMDQRGRAHPSDQNKYAELADREMQKAQQYKADHGFDLPDQTWWQEEDPSMWGGMWNVDDPLNWYG